MSNNATQTEILLKPKKEFGNRIKEPIGKLELIIAFGHLLNDQNICPMATDILSVTIAIAENKMSYNEGKNAITDICRYYNSPTINNDVLVAAFKDLLSQSNKETQIKYHSLLKQI